jgi:hypothetical protein
MSVLNVNGVRTPPFRIDAVSEHKLGNVHRTLNHLNGPARDDSLPAWAYPPNGTEGDHARSLSTTQGGRYGAWNSALVLGVPIPIIIVLALVWH